MKDLILEVENDILDAEGLDWDLLSPHEREKLYERAYNQTVNNLADAADMRKGER